jgi:hypothetical protein
MDIIRSVMSESTFWSILLFLHFLMAVALLAAVTLQAVTALIPARQTAGHFSERGPLPAAAFVKPIVILYVIEALFGAWIYVKYRTYVRIPMEAFRQWKTVGSFELKEHVLAMGLALLPAYWYFWHTPRENAAVRNWITVFLAISVWYAFIVGHVANDFRGVGS